MSTSVDLISRAEDTDNCVNDEIEALQSIYVHELEINKEKGLPVLLSVRLHPATADNKDQQYVCMTLVFKLSENYPQELPDISVRNPRGLSDEEIYSIVQGLYRLASQHLGGPMLFELIEFGKDQLTQGNTPSCQCVICLYQFEENDAFIKTECYHYFHQNCLYRYALHGLKEDNTSEEIEVPCPVCRGPIKCKLNILKKAPPPLYQDEKWTPSSEDKVHQEEMAKLFSKQKHKGGIIDIEAEKNKYLLDISTIPSLEIKTEPQLSLLKENSASFSDSDFFDSAAKKVPEKSLHFVRSAQGKFNMGNYKYKNNDYYKNYFKGEGCSQNSRYNSENNFKIYYSGYKHFHGYHKENFKETKKKELSANDLPLSSEEYQKDKEVNDLKIKPYYFRNSTNGDQTLQPLLLPQFSRHKNKCSKNYQYSSKNSFNGQSQTNKSMELSSIRKFKTQNVPNENNSQILQEKSTLSNRNTIISSEVLNNQCLPNVELHKSPETFDKKLSFSLGLENLR